MHRRRRPVLANLLGLVLPVLVVAFRVHYEENPAQTPFLHNGILVIIAAWLGGLVPGLVATGSHLLVVALWVLPLSGATFSGFLLLFVQGALLSLFGEARWRAVTQWQSLTRELEARVTQRTADLADSKARLEAQTLEQERTIEELVQTSRRLEASNRELEEFASVASHDLQEPLRKIRTFSDRLLQRHAAGLDPEGRDYLNRSARAAERMTQLIEDLLTYSRLTTRAQPHLPVDLAKIAADVISDLEGRIAESQAIIDLKPLPTIEADKAQMRQLLQNLVANALKFVAPGEVPQVQISGAIEPGPLGAVCRLVVADRGIGIEEHHREKIFDMFKRLHGRDVYEGTGIGLAVCRKIAERHNGEIHVFANPGGGSRFEVTLPIGTPSRGEETVHAPNL